MDGIVSTVEFTLLFIIKLLEPQHSDYLASLFILPKTKKLQILYINIRNFLTR